MALFPKERHGEGPRSTRSDGGALPSLRRNFSWTLFGNIVYSACNWAFVLEIAKFGSPTMMGQYAIGQAVTAPIILLARLQLRSLQVTDTHHVFSFHDYLGLRVIALTLALAGIALVTLGFYQGETARVILATGVFGSVEGLSDIIYGMMQKNERMKPIAQSMALKGLLCLPAMGTAVILTRGVFWGIVSLATVSVSVLVFFDIPNAIRLLGETVGWGSGEVKRHPDPIRYLSLVWISLPIGITVMINSLTSNISRYYIDKHVGEYGLGIFAAVASLLGIGVTVTGALGQSACPRLAQLYAAGYRAEFFTLLWKIVATCFLIGVVPLVACAIAGRGILSLVFKPEYAREGVVLAWLMASGVPGYAISGGLGVGLTAARHFKIQIPLSLVGLLVAALTSYLLIPLGGLRGAAVSVFVTQASMLAFYIIASINLARDSYWVRGGLCACAGRTGTDTAFSGSKSNIRRHKVGR